MRSGRTGLILNIAAVWFLLSILFAISGCGGGSAPTKAPSPETAPTVTVVTPTNGATGVSVSTAISAAFSEPITASTLSTSTFLVKGPDGAAVAGTVTYSPGTVTATFTPSANLAYNTQYTATITTGVSAYGDALKSNYSWSFTTVQAPPSPTVTATTPSNGAAGVAANTAITATFSTAMNASTITASTFRVTGPAGAAVAGVVSYAGSVATFTPSAHLAYNAQYTATITTGAQNSAGTALAVNYNWSFTTAQAPVVPTVTATTPADGSAGITVDTAITAVFSDPMNAATINSSTFTLTRAGVTTTGSVTYDAASKVAAFTPSGALAYNATYTATITTGASSAAGAALASDHAWSFTTVSAPDHMATIDFANVKQTIRGFGGSTAWMNAMPGTEADTLFGTGTNQLGLSILRVRIDPTSTTSGTQWDAEVGNALAAQSRGAIVFASPWTPPAAWKASSPSEPYSATCDKTPSSLCGGYLDPAHYADYADYLESFVTYMHNSGVDLYGISMQNEPDARVGYESCDWTAEQMHTWVANNASVLTTKLIMPESQNFLPSYADPTLNDSNAVGKVGIVGGHLYGVQPSYYANAFNKGKEVWMTEWYPMNGTSGTLSISDALVAAKSIHDSLVTANYSAYVWWWAANWMQSMNYGLVDMSYNPTYYGYAMSQFSKFIRSGYVRTDATANPNTSVYVSAYKGNGHAVIVAINMGTSAVSQSFTIQNQAVTTLTPYQTTATAKMAPQSSVGVSEGTFTYSLPAQSITTFVQ